MSKTKRPNILIFCTDEQCADHLSCMGHPDVKTPNIDRIAAEGTLFRNCYSTNPVCMPARATMVTGLTSRAHGVVDNSLDLDKRFPTLPGWLAESGYRTHAVGKLHLAGRGGKEIAEDEDFSVHPERRIYWDWPGHWKGAYYKHFPNNYFGFQTVELAQGHVHYIFGDYVTWLEENHPGAYAQYHSDDGNKNPYPLDIDPDLHYNNWIADRTISFIEEQSKEESPFFVWCSFPDPHEPFAAVKKWSDFYDDVEIELNQNQLELSPDSRSETMKALGLGTDVIEPELLKKAIRQTYGMVSHVDEQVGRVLDALEEQGIAEDTVIMFISDHGDQLGDHGLFYKSVYPYDRHAHIPFLIKAPGGVKGKVVDDVVSMLDMVPTALDLAGIPHDELPGEVLTPVVTGAEEPKRKNALVEHERVKSEIGPVKMRALVTDDYKLVNYPLQGETMLFDRKVDPQELRNLAYASEYQGVVEDMFKMLNYELARTKEPPSYVMKEN